MKVLLTGALSPLHWAMVERIMRDGHQVTLLGHGAAPQPARAKAVLHDISPNHPSAQQVLRGGRFDAIVFFYAYESTETQAYGTVQGALLDGLVQFQYYAEENAVSHFILVTDARVFGQLQQAGELESPIPDSPNGILIKAAEDCLRFSEQGGPKTLLIRVTNLYAPDSAGGFFGQVRDCAREQRTLQLHGAEASPCDFLHADDLAHFVNLALAESVTGTVHLAYDQDMTYGRVVERLREHFPDLSVQYTQEETREHLLVAERARVQLDWVPRHDWGQELGTILGRAEETERPRLRQKAAAWFQRVTKGKAIPWIELILLAVIAHYMKDVTQRYALFRFVDFWLFYVILIGSMHGTFFGVIAAGVACLSYGLDWVTAGNDAYLLLVNVDNWLPLVMYLLGGGVFGYIHQSSQAKIDLLTREKEQREEEAQFIETMYQQAYDDRNKLQEQVMRSRDSYGRIYSIARELDTLQPEQVFLSTLNVLEDTMQNKSVALYSCTPGSLFIRLVVHSRELGKRLAKSIDLKSYPLLTQSMHNGEMFVNSALEQDLPAFAAPVRQDGKTIALIVLWDVPFEKQTLYYRNLFNVVVGLVQSSMVRALQYFGNSADMYLENTIILSDKAFRSAMGVYRTMRKQKASNFLLLRIEGIEGHISIEQMGERMRKAVRTTDICGRLSNGTYYALLPQASLENLPQINNRFRSAGLLQTVASLESLDV